MKAWMLAAFEGLDAMSMSANAARTEPGVGEVVLRVRAAGLNPADRYLSEAQYPAKPPLPHILGREAVGEVIVRGDGAERFAVGDRVVILRGEIGVDRWGTFAEEVVVPEALLAPLPEGWTEEEIAGAPLAGMTAWQAIKQWEDLPEKGIVLVTGASGGVGHFGVQLARALGHRVIALSRHAEKRNQLEKLGAEWVVDPTAADWGKKLKDGLGAQRVDLVIDNVAGPGFTKVIDVLGYRGRVSCVGRLAGPVPEFNTSSLFFRRIRIGGVAVGDYTTAQAQEAWTGVVAALKSVGGRPLVDSVYPFEELPAAFERLRAGPMGKVLLRVTG